MERGVRVACGVSAWAVSLSLAPCVAWAQAGTSTAPPATTVTTEIDPVTGRPVGVRGDLAPTAMTGTPGVAVEPPEVIPRWSHLHQFTVRVAGSEGWAFAVHYANGQPCNTADSQFCQSRSPIMVDGAIGFGVSHDLEIELRGRVGENVFTGTVPWAVGVGFRYYGNPDERVKFSMGMALLADLTSGGTVRNWTPDVLVRFEPGVHVDITHHFGVYAQVGGTFAFIRALGLVLDAGLGVQVRFP